MKKVFNWLFKENPVFGLLLGMCSTLAVSTTFENSYIMGISVFVVLLLSTVIASLISKYINQDIRIPAYIIIIATLVTVIELLLKKYSISLYNALGIYLPLITVNCIILGKVLSYDKKNKIKENIKDAIKTGVGYITAISILGLLREIIGSNSITIMNNLSTITGYKAVYKIFPNNLILPNNIFVTSAGAFILLGVIIAIINFIKNKEGKV
jgi:electron transport complex protein RnfE